MRDRGSGHMGQEPSIFLPFITYSKQKSTTGREQEVRRGKENKFTVLHLTVSSYF